MDIMNTQFSAMEEIAATIAHEIKNPLSVAFAKLKQLEVLATEEEKNSYKTIKKELCKIDDLVMQFLNLSKPMSNLDPCLCFEPVYICDILQQSVDRYASAYPHISFELFNFVCTKKDPAVLGRETRLTMLFENILKNAIEAIDEAGVFCGSIIVSVEENEQNNSLLINIADNGAGLSQIVEKNLTIQNLDTNYFTTKKLGTGLGLGICNKIAKEHGGSFSLENGENGGCLAKVTLPLI